MKDNNRRAYPNTPTAAERKRQILSIAAQAAQAIILTAAVMLIINLLWIATH